MIIYFTKKAIEKYEIKIPNELSDKVIRNIALQTLEKEKGNELLEWSANLFYFEKIQCIQVLNYASNFSLFLINIKKEEYPEIPNMIASYLFEIYNDDKEMNELLEKLFEEHIFAALTKLEDRKRIEQLSSLYHFYIPTPERFFDFIENGVFQTKKLNKYINEIHRIDMIDGKNETFNPKSKFKELLVKKYKNELFII